MRYRRRFAWLRRLSSEPVLLLLLGAALGAVAATLFLTGTGIGGGRFHTWTLFAMDAAIATVGGGVTAFASADPVPLASELAPGEYVTISAAEWRQICADLGRVRRLESKETGMTAALPEPAPRAPPPPAPRKTVASMGPLAAIAASPRRGAEAVVYHEEPVPDPEPPVPSPRETSPRPSPADELAETEAYLLGETEPKSAPPAAYDESPLVPSASPETPSSPPSAPRPVRAIYDESAAEELNGLPIPTEVQDLLSKWYGRDKGAPMPEATPVTRTSSTSPLTPPAPVSGDHCVVCQRGVAPEPNRYVCRSCGEPICDGCWVKAREGGHPEVCGLCRILGNSAVAPRRSPPGSGGPTGPKPTGPSAG